MLKIDEINADKIDIKLDQDSLKLTDKWILHELDMLIENSTQALDEFKINDYTKALYEFFWHKFCDWYIEISKTII